MFMIHTPQTIQLFGLKPEDGKEAIAEGTITFQHETEDVSKCQMVVRVEDRTYTYTFGTRGPIVETAYADDATRKRDEELAKEREAGEAKRVEAERHSADEANKHELRTAADTTAADISWDAAHPQNEGFAGGHITPGPNPFADPMNPPPGAQAAYHPGEPQHG